MNQFGRVAADLSSPYWCACVCVCVCVCVLCTVQSKTDDGCQTETCRRIL